MGAMVRREVSAIDGLDVVGAIDGLDAAGCWCNGWDGGWR